MERYIRYERLVEKIKLNNKFQYDPKKFFDDLITQGWEIIYYNEKEIKHSEGVVPELEIVVVVGRKQKIEL